MGFFVAANMLIQIVIQFQAVCFADGEEIFVMKLKSSCFLKESAVNWTILISAAKLIEKLSSCFTGGWAKAHEVLRVS